METDWGSPVRIIKPHKVAAFKRPEPKVAASDEEADKLRYAAKQHLMDAVANRSDTSASTYSGNPRVDLYLLTMTKGPIR